MSFAEQSQRLGRRAPRSANGQTLIEGAGGTNFETRTRLVFRALAAIHISLIIGHAIFGADIRFSLMHAMLWLGMYVSIRLVKDPVKFFICCHPTILFSITPYIYSTIHLHLVDYGLFDALRSTSVAFFYQCGMYLPVIFFAARENVGTEAPRNFLSVSSVHSTMLKPIIFRSAMIVGSVGVVAQGLPLTPAGFALVDQIQMLFWVGISLHLFERRKLYPFSAEMIMALILCATVTLMANARSFLLEFVFFMAVAHLMFAGRAISWRWIVPAWLLLSVLSTFSAITIEIRYAYPRGSPEKAAAYATALMSPEALASILIPGHTYNGLNLSGRAETGSLSGFYTPYFRRQSGMFERVTLLPMMDIVTGRVGEVTDVKWKSISDIFKAVIPFAPDKDLLYSDRLTWDLGLRNRDVIGRPMVTAAGELYTMGGYLAVALFGAGFSLLLWIEYNILIRIAGKNPFSTQLFLHTMLYATITSTALSCAALVLRSLPIVIVITVALELTTRAQGRTSAPLGRNWARP